MREAKVREGRLGLIPHFIPKKTFADALTKEEVAELGFCDHCFRTNHTEAYCPQKSMVAPEARRPETVASNEVAVPSAVDAPAAAVDEEVAENSAETQLESLDDTDNVVEDEKTIARFRSERYRQQW